jgi:hypothetical protein
MEEELGHDINKRMGHEQSLMQSKEPDSPCQGHAACALGLADVQGTSHVLEGKSCFFFPAAFLAFFFL